MPIIQVTLVEGRNIDAVREFSKAVIQAAVEVLGAPAPSVRVIVHQIPSGLFVVGENNAARHTDDRVPQAPA